MIPMQYALRRRMMAKEIIPPDENTILLLHGEDLTDGSIYGHGVTNSGVSASTAQSKFGGKSLYFNGSSKLQIPASSLFEFGTGDWTFDAWIYPLTNAKDNLFLSGTAKGALIIGRVGDNTQMGIGRNSTAWDILVASRLTKNTWNHFAVVKASGTVRIFVNGVLAHSVSNSQSYGMLNAAMDIGCMSNNYYFTGYMDEVRLSNVARWTSNFTPPTEPYNPEGTGGSGDSGGGSEPSSNATVQIIGTFTGDGAESSVTINGVAYTTPTTVTVPKGTPITLKTDSGAAGGSNSGQIIINGTTVATQTDIDTPIQYTYTAETDCVIEGFTVGYIFNLAILGIRVTT